MLQVDREIAKAESQIAKLKKKQQEQEAASRRSTSEDDSDKKEEQETKQPKSVSQTIYADNRVRRKLRQTLYFVEYVSQIAQLVEYHLYRNALNTKSQSPKGQFIPLGKQTKWFGVHFVECGIETKVQTLLRSPSFLPPLKARHNFLPFPPDWTSGLVLVLVIREGPFIKRKSDGRSESINLALLSLPCTGLK